MKKKSEAAEKIAKLQAHAIRIAAQMDQAFRDIEIAYRAIAALPDESDRWQLRKYLDERLAALGMPPKKLSIPRRQTHAYLMSEAEKARRLADTLDRGGNPKRAADYLAAAKENEDQAWRAPDAPRRI